MAKNSPVPWYLPLDKSHFSISSFRLTSVGRFITKSLVFISCFLSVVWECVICMAFVICCFNRTKYLVLQVKTLELVGLAPQGSSRVSSFLETAAEGLVEGGR